MSLERLSAKVILFEIISLGHLLVLHINFHTDLLSKDLSANVFFNFLNFRFDEMYVCPHQSLDLGVSYLSLGGEDR